MADFDDDHLRSLLGLPSLTPDERIYRVIPIDYLFDMFASQTNVLANPRTWPDPFERAVVTTVFPSTAVFAQCWTRHTASDAMWRVYSSQATSVRIRTTTLKLARGLLLAQRASTSKVAIAGVDYLHERQLVGAVVGRRSDQQPSAKLRCLFLKRRAYLHEREVRLAMLDETGSTSDELYRYPVSPEQLVEQVMVDPRLAEDEAERLKIEIRERTGLPKRSVLRSLLYSVPAALRQFTDEVEQQRP